MRPKLGGFLLGVGLIALVSGCASKQQWSVSEARSCAPSSAPRVCVFAEPDHGHVIGVGDVELVPGECALASSEARGGLLEVASTDGVGVSRSKWVSTPKGRVTLIELDAEGRIDAHRQACDQQAINVDAKARRE